MGAARARADAPMPGWVNFVVAGLLTGAVYGLMALGLSVIFGVTRIVNFAHGEMMVLGMYAAILLSLYGGLDPMAAAPVVALGLFVLGYALQRGVINRYIMRPEHEQFLLMLGLALMLTSTMLMVFGPDARNVQTDYALDSYAIGDLIVDKVRVFAALGAVFGALLLGGFFKFTRSGKAIRACADNQVGAQVVGLDVGRLYAITFGIGAACVGIAGTLMVLLVDVQPYLGTDYTLLSFIIVILGGLGSMPGALLGGLLVGVSEGLSAYLIAPSLKSMTSFAMLILVLLMRPEGLLGRRA
jgi:branched-chain amino acid transport system permease protein